MQTLTWLHFSDFHCGQQRLGNFFGNIEEKLCDDLKKLQKDHGPPDVIFFSGDLTQGGKSQEYEIFNTMLDRIYTNCLHSKPVLLPVPGNHDLNRPDPTLPEIILLSEWTNRHDDVQPLFWENPEGPFRQAVNDSFANYLYWFHNHPFPKPKEFKAGCIPGDYSATIEINGFKLGVVGLNTAFLQLKEGDYEKKLALHPIQLMEVCGIFPSDWAKKHHLCLLVTHHPPEWLTTEARGYLDREIAAFDRFAIHLFGHMHESHTISSSRDGDVMRRYCQGISLFGLDTWGKENESRSHGYIFGQLKFGQKPDRCTLRYWPRKAFTQAEGWKIDPDNSFRLDADGGKSPEEIKLKSLFPLGGLMPTQKIPTAKKEAAIFQDLLVSPIFFDDPGIMQESTREDLVNIFQKYISQSQASKNKSKRIYDVAVVGNACTDLFLFSNAILTSQNECHSEERNVIGYPIGSKILIDKFEFHTGGGGVNVSATFSRLGLKTAFLGRVGIDIRGVRLLRWMHDHDIMFIGQIGDEKTAYSVILSSQAVQDHTILTFRGSSNNLTVDKLPPQVMNAKWIYGASMFGRSYESQRKLFALVKQKRRDIKIAYSPGVYVCRMGIKPLESILKNTDVLILNKEGAKYLLDQDKLIDLAEGLSKYGPKIVSVSDGSNGVAIYSDNNGKFHIQPDKSRVVVNTTGAGDAFGSGFLAGLIKEKSIEDAALMGVLNAEQVIKTICANKGIENITAMEKQLKDRNARKKHIITRIP